MTISIHLKKLLRVLSAAGIVIAPAFAHAAEPSVAESVVVKDSFSTNDFSRKAGDSLQGQVPEEPTQDSVWQVASSGDSVVFAPEGAIVLSKDGIGGDARLRIPGPEKLITLSARVVLGTSDWVAVGFFAESGVEKGNWFDNGAQGGALVWMLLRPNGNWTVFSNGVKRRLLYGGPADFPSVLFKEGAAYTIGMSFDPFNGKIRPFISDGDTEASLYAKSNGWLDARLPSGITIAAAGFRINGTDTTLAGTASVDDFFVTEAHSDMLRFTQLPEAIRSRVPLGTPRVSSAIEDSPFGVHTTIMHEGGDPEYIGKAVDLISEAGFKWAVDYLANSGTDHMSPEEVEAKFSNLSRAIDYASRLQEADINLLVRLDPFRWAPRGKEAPYDYEPGSVDMLRALAFTRQVVRQLKPYTHHWQIWNEPNLGNTTPYITPENYVKLFKQIAAVIREEQPEAVLYGPGTAMLQCLADEPYPWIPRVLDAGLLDYVDVFTFHPYRQPAIRECLPEYASEFYPWKTWGSYEKQIADLKDRMRSHLSEDREIRIGATEDGLPDLINGAGEQQLSWIVTAKYELRRALLDFYLGLHPRTIFCLYRPIADPFYSEQSSFSIVTANYQKKPVYNAAQNLNAVLDSSYRRADEIPVRISATSEDAKPEGDVKVQTYYKDYGDFEELLVFYWSAEVGHDVHPHYKAELQIDEAGWEAPLLIDLMSMPVPRPSKAPVEIIDSKFVDRRDPKPLVGQLTESGVAVNMIDVRDYPMLVKWVRLKE